MAIHTDLPIYKVTYELMLLAMQLIKNMPRDFKGSTGKRINDECLGLTMLVYHANCAKDKTPYLDKLIERAQVVELLARLICDLKLIAPAQYAKVIGLTASISRQAKGWRKQSAPPPVT